MEVEYRDYKGNTFCFTHAVKRIIENDEDIKAVVDESDPGESGYFSFCIDCSKE